MGNLAGMQDGLVQAAPPPMMAAAPAALPPVQHIPAPQQVPVPAPVPAPTQPLEVKFHMPDGSQYVCYYHAVIQPEGQPTLVLVVDLHGNALMQRFTPPLSPRGSPMTVEIRAHNLVLRAYSIGIKFAYDEREYTVLVIDQGQESHGENGTAGSGGFAM